MIQPGVIRLSQFINHPPAKVWRALTDPEIHATWWAAGDVPSRRRPPVHARYGALGGTAVGSHRGGAGAASELQLRARHPRYDDHLAFGARERGHGVHLEQSGFDLESPLGKAAFDGMGHGWPGALERMATAIDSSEAV